MANMKKLTKRETLFASEYLKDLNGKAAAIRAGYSPKSARDQAYKILQRSHVKAHVGNLSRENLVENDIAVSRIVAELAAIAFFDPRKLYDEDGNLKPIKDLPESVARAIGGVEVTERTINDVTIGKTKLKINDKIKALEVLAKHYKMFSEAPNIIDQSQQVHIYLPDNGRDRPASEVIDAV